MVYRRTLTSNVWRPIGGYEWTEPIPPVVQRNFVLNILKYDSSDQTISLNDTFERNQPNGPKIVIDAFEEKEMYVYRVWISGQIVVLSNPYTPVSI